MKLEILTLRVSAAVSPLLGERRIKAAALGLWPDSKILHINVKKEGDPVFTHLQLSYTYGYVLTWQNWEKNLALSVLLCAYSLLSAESVLVSGVTGKKSEYKLP